MWTSVGRLDLPAGGRLVPAHTRRQTRKRVIVVPSVATPAWRGQLQARIRCCCDLPVRKEKRAAARPSIYRFGLWSSVSRAGLTPARGAVGGRRGRGGAGARGGAPP